MHSILKLELCFFVNPPRIREKCKYHIKYKIVSQRNTCISNMEKSKLIFLDNNPLVNFRRYITDRFPENETATLLDSHGKMIATFAAMEKDDGTDDLDNGEPHHVVKRRVKRTDASLAEQLSKNVTKILEDLLKDYDKTERPSFKKGNRENYDNLILF